MSPSQQQLAPRFTSFYCSMSALLLLCFLQTCASLDTISANQTISDGETIVSAGNIFEMGFFSPGNSRNRYIGIWYHKISPQTIVWVANRVTPITNTSGGGGVLRLNPIGVLEIQNTTNSVIWSSNSSGSVRNSVAQLLDNGNFIIKDESESNSDNFIWQSFDFPADNLLPSMKVGKNLVTGRQWSYTSWKSADDPSPGNFTTFIDTNGYPQMIMMRGSDIVFRSGPWNGIRFSGEPNMRPNQFHTYEFVFSQRGIYYHDEQTNSVITRSVIWPDGDVTRLIWIESSQQWTAYVSRQTDRCDTYGLCGVYGSCNINNFPACGCLEGFEPRFSQQWNVANWSGGCQRRTPLGCQAEEGFRKYSDKKLPDTRHSWYNLTMNLDECQQLCKSNCSCTAYANTDIRGSGSGCVLWFDELFDTRDFPNAGQDIFVRMAASELIPVTSQRKNSKVLEQVRIIIPVILALGILLGLLLLLVLKRRKLKREGRLKQNYTTEVQKDDLELPLFGLSTLLTATNNFSFNSKLGEGGFGPVYKGVLEEGQEIAVKRLSKTSSQGLDEFKNEVICISKLQHRNLVKLLGCCIEGEEKTLVYEYMENKSLDFYIFDNTQRKLLDWPRRWHIINGIARGLLYLHQDSRLRIIHRDLKASNILLDSNMNPKISDFGMARSFGENETEANTIRVVGTYGYMSPEYAGEGIFSVKSDAFSFGVLVLEILSGKRNRGFTHQDHNHNLLGHAWRLYQEGRSPELVDANLGDSIDSDEALRAIQVGLLCVQQDPEDRPLMSSVVLMLGSEGAICTPKHPGFFNKRTVGDEKYNSSAPTTTSNEVTITMLNGR